MRFQMKNESLLPQTILLTEKDQWAYAASEAALRYQAIEFSDMTLRGELNIKPISASALSVLGRLSLSFDVRCASCELPFRLNLDSDIAELFCLDSECGSAVDSIRAHSSQGIDITYVASPEIDLSELVSERIRTELPYYMYCSSKCTPMALGPASHLGLTSSGVRNSPDESSRSIA